MTLEEPQVSSNAFFSPEEEIYGHDYNHWIVKYWETFGQPKEKQKYPVFCASGLEEGKENQFTIPSKKAVLMSPVKFIGAVPTKKFKTDEVHFSNKLYETCEYEMDIIEDMNFFIDGELMSPYCRRLMSSLFTLEHEDAEYTCQCSGYWLMFRPNILAQGRHDIDMFSSCKAGTVQIPAKYEIQIVK